MDSKQPLIESCWCYTRGEREKRDRECSNWKRKWKVRPGLRTDPRMNTLTFCILTSIGSWKVQKIYSHPAFFFTGVSCGSSLVSFSFLVMLLVFSVRRAFCLKGVLNHLTRVSSICRLTSKNTHKHACTHTHTYSLLRRRSQKEEIIGLADPQTRAEILMTVMMQQYGIFILIIMQRACVFVFLSIPM